MTDIREEVQSSFKKLLDTVSEIPEEEISEIGRFQWTRNENLGGSILANSANHYRWAKNRIRSWMKRTGRF